MKSRLLTYSAVIAIAAAGPSIAFAEDQTPAAPAGTQYAPAPTVEEELVYLRDIIALQTLRLDEAEQTLARQNALIEEQGKKLATFERVLASVQSGQAMFAASGFYTVKSGDTLGKIASDHGTSVDQLAAANDLRSPYNLSVGQKIAVPGGEAPTTPQLAPAKAPVVAEAAPAPAAQQTLAEKATQGPAEPAKQEPQKVADLGAPMNPVDRPDVSSRALNEQRKAEEAKESGLPQEVGVRPEEERPYLSVFSDVGGILTPKGTLYVEPAIDFTSTSDNRFFFQGIEIADAILIGAIEATDSDRRALTESLGLRYGITSRLEIDGRIAYIQRHDRISGVAIDDLTTTVRELNGSGMGDVEIGLHYQINEGRNFPYAIANIRGKAPTGTGPFEVARNPGNGVELELATGSGYWTIEPSLTFILPSDPAVIFANIGYQYNMPTTPDAAVGPAIVRELDPGDALRTSVGIGLSLNERFSMNFGYDQSYFFATTTLLESGPPDMRIFTLTRQPSTTVGSFLFGGSYAVNDRLRINLNSSFGATDEAPDLRISLRAQVRLFD